jgi:hypothetical protein
VPNPAEEEVESGKVMAASSVSPADQSRLADLMATNKKLEEELQMMQEALIQKDNSEHFRKIQELFNKI